MKDPIKSHLHYHSIIKVCGWQITVIFSNYKIIAMQKLKCWDLAVSEKGVHIVAKSICFTISASILTCHNFSFIHFT